MNSFYFHINICGHNLIQFLLFWFDVFITRKYALVSALFISCECSWVIELQSLFDDSQCCVLKRLFKHRMFAIVDCGRVQHDLNTNVWNELFLKTSRAQRASQHTSLCDDLVLELNCFSFRYSWWLFCSVKNRLMA